MVDLQGRVGPARFGPKRDSCFGPKRESCFDPKRESRFDPKRESLLPPKRESLFHPIVNHFFTRFCFQISVDFGWPGGRPTYAVCIVLCQQT